MDLERALEAAAAAGGSSARSREQACKVWRRLQRRGIAIPAGLYPALHPLLEDSSDAVRVAAAGCLRAAVAPTRPSGGGGGGQAGDTQAATAAAAGLEAMLGMSGPAMWDRLFVLLSERAMDTAVTLPSPPLQPTPPALSPLHPLCLLLPASAPLRCLCSLSPLLPRSAPSRMPPGALC